MRETTESPILYLYEYNDVPTEISRWKNDEELIVKRPEQYAMRGCARRTHSVPPSRLCVGIGTYKTQTDGEIYLCVLIAPTTRIVASYAIGVYRSAELVGRALQLFFDTYPIALSPIVIRSSRNAIYHTEAYRKILSQYPVIPEMTQKGTRGGVMAVSTFFSQLMRRKGNCSFITWQDAVDWLCDDIFQYNQSREMFRINQQ